MKSGAATPDGGSHAWLSGGHHGGDGGVSFCRLGGEGRNGGHHGGGGGVSFGYLGGEGCSGGWLRLVLHPGSGGA